MAWRWDNNFGVGVKMADFSDMKRNFDNIQFSELRKKVDGKYNEVHDELSDCYYNKKPFRTYGVLNKESFEKLHGLIFTMLEVKFHTENLKQAVKDRIPESTYNEEFDNDGTVTGKKNEQAILKVSTLNSEGFQLEV